MKFTRWLPVVALGAFAADCGTGPTDSETETDTDTFCFDCELLIAFVDAVCDDNGNGSSTANPRVGPFDDSIALTVEAGAWAGAVEVDLADTGDPNANRWTESKLFPETANTSFCEDGSCDVWEHTLNEVGTVGEVGDSSTILNCAWYATSNEGVLRGLAIKATIFDDASPAAEADCVIWGHNSSTQFSGDGCACAEEWLATPPASPCGDHD